MVTLIGSKRMRTRLTRSSFLRVSAGALATSLAAPEMAVNAASRARETVTLRLSITADPSFAALIKRALAPLKAKGITVNLEPQPPSDLKQITQIVTGTAADVYAVGDQVAQVYAAKGAVAPLDSFLSKDKIPISTWYPFLMSFNHAKFGPNKGKLIAVPNGWADLALIYNKTLFDKAKVPYPTADWTWDDFLQAARELTIRGKGRTVQYGAQIDTFYRMTEPIIWSWGGDLCNGDGTKVAGYMNSPKTVTALQWYVDLVRRYHVMPSPAETAAFPTGFDPFNAGQVAMQINGSWGVAQWRQNPHLHFGVANVPRNAKTGLRFSNYFEGGWGLNPHTAHPNEAWEMIKALALPAGDAILSHQEHLPVTPAAVKMLGWDHDYHHVFIEQTNYMRYVPNDARGLDTVAAVADTYTAAIDHVLTHPTVSVEAAFNKAAADGEKELQRFAQQG